MSQISFYNVKVRDRAPHGAVYFIGILTIAAAHAQVLAVTPPRGLIDVIPVIRATGLQAREHVKIRAELVDGSGNPWHSEAEFEADSEGVIDVSKQAPVKGSYKNVSAAGLIWSMTPDVSNVNIYQQPKQLGPQVTHFKLERNGQSISSADFEQISMAPGVKRVELKGGLHGLLFEPEGDGPFRGVLVVGGSEGGVPARNAAWLASHGYAALALAYFKWEGLPSELSGIPLEYFGDAIGWMSKRPEIAKGGIAVMGGSRGGELALQLGSMYPEVKAVIALVPANTRHGSCCRFPIGPAWTWKGRPLPFTPRLNGGGPMEQASEIPVEHIGGPVLLISGQDDGVWESSRMSDRVIGRLKSAHFQYEFEQLKYPHAGHRAGHPGIFPTWHHSGTSPLTGREMHYGGSPEGDAASSLDATPKMLEFLGRSFAATAGPK
jgi:dienelactone hydrolase